MSALHALSIVLDGPPGHEAGRFVEVENEQGASVGVGEWRERTDGLWELRLPLHAGRAYDDGRKTTIVLDEQIEGMVESNARTVRVFVLYEEE